MKNRAIQRFTSAALAVALLASTAISVSAKPVSSKKTTGTTTTSAVAKTTSAKTSAEAALSTGYLISSKGSSFQISGDSVQAEYDLKTTDVTLTMSQKGNVVLSFKTPDGKTSNLNLNAQTNYNFDGDFASITISGAVPEDRFILISGKVTNLNVNGPANVLISEKATVSSLKAGAANADIHAYTGAKITTASAVKSSSITGYSGKIGTMKAVTTTAAPAATTVKKSSSGLALSGGKTSSSTVNNAGKTPVDLNINEADDSQNTLEVNITGNTSVELVARDGVSLGLAMKDVDLEVTRDTDKDSNKVGGQWKWVDTTSTTYTSGTYTYRFTPSLPQYATVDVKVNYVGSGTAGKSLGKPGISFTGKSHGNGGDVSIRVTFPEGMRDDTTLYLKADDREVEYSVDESDAGDDRTYTVTIDPALHEDGDKIKISAKIKDGSRTATSKTLSYLFEAKK